MAYKHGVYVSENATSLTAPVTGNAGLQVVVGTAPVNTVTDPAAAVNVPVLVNSYAEAVAAVGYSDDFESYTICQAISAAFQVIGCGPLVLINVLDPANTKFTAAVSEQQVQVNNKIATVPVKGLLKDGLTVKGDASAVLKAGEDYTASFDDEGNLLIALIGSKTATTLTVSGKKLDPGKVTAADIVGGVDTSTGKVSGLEVVQQVYPKLGLTPGILLAPGFSKDATVAAALQAKTTGINGSFRCICVCDVDSGATGAKVYTDVKTKKEANGLNGANCYAVWPCAKVGTKVYSGSAIVAAEMAYQDASNDDVPNMGIEFVGQRVWATHAVLRKSTVRRMKREVRKISEDVRDGVINRQEYQRRVASIRGMMDHTNSGALRWRLNEITLNIVGEEYGQLPYGRGDSDRKAVRGGGAAKRDHKRAA